MADNTFELKIITPERKFYDEQVTMVEFNTSEGEIGIYKNHVPTTVIIKPGILRITNGDEQKVAALHAGFVEILGDKVTVLAEVIESPEEIDLERAESSKERAKARIDGKEEGIDMARAEVSLLRAVTRIQAAKLK